MCDPNKECENFEFDMSACGDMKACKQGVTGVLALNMDSFLGKILCVGDMAPPEKKKRIRKPKFAPLEGWKSHREILAEKDRAVKNKYGKRVRLKAPEERYTNAITTRMELPQLTARDIRRVRFPYTVALVMELEEDGFLLASSILQGYIHYNDTMRSLATRGSPFFDEPPLSERPELLEKLATGLAAMDGAGQTDPPNCAIQVDSLLELGFSLMNLGETVAWIVEKVLLMSINISKGYAKDGHKREALARFAYGCFLTHFNLYDTALQELETARNLAIGKTWTLDFEYENKYDVFHLEITDVLCRILLLMARRVRVSNPYQAVRYCSRALRRVGDKALKVLQAEALLELGLAYKEGSNYLMAEQAFLEYLRRYTDISYATGICTAYLEGAVCYSRLGNVKKAREFLFYVLEAAEQTGLQSIRARAQRYIGESFLKMSYFHEASRCLEDSFKMNVKLNNVKETDYVRILAGISKGMEIMPKMAALLNDCITDLTGNNLLQLLQWKFHRTPFWDTKEEDAPQLPDSSLYTQLTEDPDSLKGVVRSSMELRFQALQVHGKITEQQKEGAALRSKLLKRKEEEYGASGLYVSSHPPSAHSAKETIIPSEISFSSAFSARLMERMGGEADEFFSSRKSIELKGADAETVIEVVERSSESSSSSDST